MLLTRVMALNDLFGGRMCQNNAVIRFVCLLPTRAKTFDEPLFKFGSIVQFELVSNQVGL